MKTPAGFCQCGCGEPTKIRTRDSSRSGARRGEHFRFVSGHGRRLNLCGLRFARLVVLARDTKRRKKTSPRWWAQCDCGKFVSVRVSDLRYGYVKSCGCLRTRHGHAARRSREYCAFYDARSRCTNPKSDNFRFYGGRGIRFRFASFKEFLAEIGPCPSPAHTLDRINPDGNYERGNVRWATWEEQRANMRHNNQFTAGRGIATDIGIEL